MSYTVYCDLTSLSEIFVLFLTTSRFRTRSASVRCAHPSFRQPSPRPPLYLLASREDLRYILYLLRENAKNHPSLVENTRTKKALLKDRQKESHLGSFDDNSKSSSSFYDLHFELLLYDLMSSVEC
jgi:hypothetical protein